MFALVMVCLAVSVLLVDFLGNALMTHAYEEEQTALLEKAYFDTCDAWANRRNVAEALQYYTADGNMTAVVWFHRQVIFITDPLLPPTGDHPLANGTYEIVRQSEASYTTLILYGKTADGVNVSLSVSGLEDRLTFINRSFGIASLIAVAVGGVIAFIVVQLLTRPVTQLSEMAGGMAQLNFEKRYDGTGSGELAALGHSLNTVSETLEQTLSELKTANVRLQADVEQSARVGEARTRFIRNVSHELKTPIALIETYAEGLHENIAEDAASREYYCSVIEDEARRLSDILAKLTTLMGLESGREELSIEHVDITAMLTRLSARYAPLLAERHITMTVTDEPCLVWGDGVLIENVITNYLTNALHHVSDDGRIELTVTATDRGTAKIAVFNTGSPIPSDDLPHLWESFYKVDKAHTREYGGSGLGLSVVAAIMNAHGMPYGVENRTDGVAFYIELQQ
jgi:signal transduction histidine kinase